MICGYIKTEGGGGLLFMPEGQEYGMFPTIKSVERKGGIVLDGPYLTRVHKTSIAAHQCAACNKIILSY
jgi:hypothetical protein